MQVQYVSNGLQPGWVRAGGQPSPALKGHFSADSSSADIFSEGEAVFIQYRNFTDVQTDRFAVSISRVSVLTRDNKIECTFHVDQSFHHYVMLSVSIVLKSRDFRQTASGNSKPEKGPKSQENDPPPIIRRLATGLFQWPATEGNTEVRFPHSSECSNSELQHFNCGAYMSQYVTSSITH